MHRHALPTKVRLVNGFSSGHVWMWELDNKESWALKNWCFRTVVLEKTLESPLDCKEIQPVHPKGDQSWILFGRTDVEAETPILWPPDGKSWLIGKDPDAGKDWGWEGKETTEDEMAGWHHQLDGHGCGWTLGVGDGQGGLVSCGPWGHRESDMTEQQQQHRYNIKSPWKCSCPLCTHAHAHTHTHEVYQAAQVLRVPSPSAPSLPAQRAASSFSFAAEPSIARMYLPGLIIHLPVGGHLVCFPIFLLLAPVHCTYTCAHDRCSFKVDKR